MNTLPSELCGSRMRLARRAVLRACVAVLLPAGMTLGGAAPAGAQGRMRLSAGAGLRTAYDSNLDHRPTAEAGMSLAGVGDLELRYTGGAGGLQLGYSVGHFRYEGAPERNRTAHTARGVLTLTPSSRLSVSTTAEALIGGLSEDREPGTEYGLTPRLELRPNDRNRLRLHSLHRVRRFGELSGKDVINHGGGVDYRMGGRGQPTLELGTRYDRTMTDDERSRFNRWTHRVTFSAPLGESTALTLGARQITRTYPHRLVELEPLAELELLPEERRILEGYTRDLQDPNANPFTAVPEDELLRWRDLPRRDEIWAPSAALTVRVLDIELRFGYDLEIRFSNDLRRGYTAHSFELGTSWRLR